MPIPGEDRPTIGQRRTRACMLLKSNREASLRLFCFPHAGGGVSVFRQWPGLLPDHVEVLGMALPGHERRCNEPFVTSVSSLTTDLAEDLLPYQERPFALWGHSLGALLAFELTRELRRRHMLSPIHLFVAGFHAPQVFNREPALHQLPDSELIDRVRQLKGIPDDVFHNPELMEIFTPILRADYALHETYVYRDEAPLDCPISALGGMQDEQIRRTDLFAWRNQTRASFDLAMFTGNHFFVRTAQSAVLQTISRLLAQYR